MSEIPHIILTRSNRKTISLQILPDATVQVRAPFYLPKFFIDRFIKEQDDWVKKRLEHVEKHRAIKQKKYLSGEEFLYLGKSYPLHIGNYEKIEIKDGKLVFPQLLMFRAKKELTAWYIKKAQEMIEKRVIINAKEMGATYLNLKFSDTKSKWGHCTPDNRLQFNWRLIMAPLLVINYVTVHELAHTVEKNHSWRFWSKVRAINPSYKQQIKWLKEYGATLVV